MRNIIYIISFFFIFSCESDNTSNDIVYDNSLEKVSAVDISYYPQIANLNHIFYNSLGEEIDFLNSLLISGVNTIRLRLWVNPADNVSSFSEVKEFSQQLKLLGFKIWITPHFSDTWAHPGQQILPSEWQSLSYNDLKNQVYSYLSNIMNEIEPDYIQIGNEINSGILFPFGDILSSSDQFIDLINHGIDAVRSVSANTKIILHFAGHENANWFYNYVNEVDYDIIGISYYPIWHGKSLTDLEQNLTDLTENFGREIIIAETAYPFTLNWNDWTNNIVGLDEQLILPNYPATPLGQQNFIKDLKNIILELDNGIGFCYWGAELIAWDGENSDSGSVWENQALFDFENKELPVLQEFNLN